MPIWLTRTVRPGLPRESRAIFDRLRPPSCFTSPLAFPESREARDPFDLPHDAASERVVFRVSYLSACEQVVQCVPEVVDRNSRSLARVVNPPLVAQSALSVQDERVRRVHRAKASGGLSAFVLEVGEVVALLSGPLHHLREGVGRRYRGIVGVNQDYLHPLLGIIPLDFHDSRLCGLRGWTTITGKNDYEDLLVIK